MKKAFTLIEIIVVVTIMGVLFAGGVVSYSSLSKSSRDAKRKSDLEQIRSAMEMYRSNDSTAMYPIGADCNEIAGVLGATYLPSLPQDPKSTLYAYSCTSDGIDYTLGAFLEATTTGCGSPGNCKSSENPNPDPADCNYCVGPYGAK